MKRDVARRFAWHLGGKAAQGLWPYVIRREAPAGDVPADHKWSDERVTEGAFVIEHPTRGDLCLDLTTWRARSHPDRYYLIVSRSFFDTPLMEFHELGHGPSGRFLPWTYSPRKRDGRNTERKKEFEGLLGALTIRLPVLTEDGGVQRFLELLYTFTETRELADEL